MTVEMRGEGQSVDRRFETGGDVTGRRKRWEVRRLECARGWTGVARRDSRAEQRWREDGGIGIRSSGRGKQTRSFAPRSHGLLQARPGWGVLRANQRGEAVSRRSRSTAAEPAAHSAFSAQSEEKKRRWIASRSARATRARLAKKRRRRNRQKLPVRETQLLETKGEEEKRRSKRGTVVGDWRRKKSRGRRRKGSCPRSRRCVGLRLGCWGCWLWLCRGRW